MNSTHHKYLFHGFFHVLAALFSNSSDFRRAWNNYPESAPPPEDIQGRWQGEWISDVNGHHGQLKAITTKVNSGKYKTSFHATYSKVLRVCYSVNLNVREEDGRFQLEGEADLGQLAGGIYRYDGEATLTEFNCEYRCEYDHGTFRMTHLNSNHP